MSRQSSRSLGPHHVRDALHSCTRSLVLTATSANSGPLGKCECGSFASALLVSRVDFPNRLKNYI